MLGEDGREGMAPCSSPGSKKGHSKDDDVCSGDPFASLLGCNLASNLLLLALLCYVLCKGGLLMQYASKRFCKGSALGRNVVLPIIEAIPNAVLVLVSGIMTLPKDTGIEHVAVGVGTMAGSSVLLLTLCWGAAVFCGRTELSLDGVMIAKLLREPFDLTQTGVSTDHSAPKAASIMLASAALYLIIEVPSLLKIRHLRWLLAVTSLFCTIVFIVYCSHQVIAPISARKADIERRLRHLRYNTVRSISYYANRYGGILLPESQEPNVAAIERMFQRFDRDHDGLLNREELCALLVAFDFCRPTPVQGTLMPPLSPSASNHDLTQPTTPVIPTNPLSRTSVGGPNSGGATGLSGTELEQMHSRLSLTPEQQQAEQQQRLFRARYGHVEHIADYWLRQWGGVRAGGVTMEAFVKSLLEWFYEKERRFVVDFPNAKPPKAVRKSGQTKFWVFTFKSPDDYQELLLQHKAKLDAAAAAAAAAHQAAQLGGKMSGVKGLLLSWRSRKRKCTQDDSLREPLLLPQPEQSVHRTDDTQHSNGKKCSSPQQPYEVYATAASEHRAGEGLASPGRAAGAAAAAAAAAAAVHREGGEHPAGPGGSAPASTTPGSSVAFAAESSTLPPSATGGGAGQQNGTVGSSGAAGGGLSAAANTHPEGGHRESGSREAVPTISKPLPHVALDVLPHGGSAIQEAEGGRTRASSSPTSSVAGAESSDFLAWEEEELTGLSGKAEWETVVCILLFAAGLVLCVLFSGPFTRTTGYVSSDLGVYPFLVAFLAGPLASHAPGIFSSVRLAATQQPQNVSIALSQIYGAVTMINTLVLGVLLGVMAVQHIKWRYTGELIITLAPTLLIGAVGASSRTIYSAWGVVAICMFPAAVFLCWVVRARLV